MRFTRLLCICVLAIPVLAGCLGGGKPTGRAEHLLPPPSTVVATDLAVDPCVVGEWLTGDWVLPGPVGELTAKGGADAHVEIRANGSAEWDFDLMDPMVMHDPDIDLTTTIHTRGIATGRVEAGGGTWSVVETDVTQLKGSTSLSIGGSAPNAGLGTFVGIQAGSYRCSGNLLSYSTQNPADGKTVNVLLHRL